MPAAHVAGEAPPARAPGTAALATEVDGVILALLLDLLSGCGAGAHPVEVAMSTAHVADEACPESELLEAFSQGTNGWLGSPGIRAPPPRMRGKKKGMARQE